MYPFAYEDVIKIIQKAGQEALRIYHSGFSVTEKSDSSPVTQADIACEEIIFNELTSLMPDIPFVGEEHLAKGQVPDLKNEFFWLVDPIDGTKEFIKKNGEFTVNIALIKGNEPVFGAVFAPVLNALYFTKTPFQAFSIIHGKKKALKTRKRPIDGVDVLCSRSHYNENEAKKMMKNLKVRQIIHKGSSLKFCEIASGNADVYPCTFETHEWDTAAAHAVLKAAGGCLLDLKHQNLRYRKKDFQNPCLIAFGDNPF